MRFLLSLAVLAATCTAYAQGDSEAIQGYTNSASANVNGITAGWTFQPNIALIVTNLGCFAKVFDDNGAVTAIQVGLWAPNGSLLASNSITPGSLLFDQSRYESITPVLLDPGQTYHAGIFYVGGNLGLDVASSTLGGVVFASPDIRSLTVASSSGGFSSPQPQPGTPIGGYLGPNFRYQTAAGGVPEPSSWLLLSLGGMLLAALRRNRRH
jgi:hypothetical protein